MTNKKFYPIESTRREISEELKMRIGAEFYRAYIRRGDMKCVLVFFTRQDHQYWLATHYDPDLWDLL